jgi:hypothetical protein
VKTVACPQCARVADYTGRPLYCLGEGTFHSGHGYRMMTVGELEVRYTRLILGGFQAGADRTRAAINAIVAQEDLEKRYSEK